MKLSTRPFSANKKLHFFITISDAPFVYTLDHVSQDKDKEYDKEDKDKDKYHDKKDEPYPQKYFADVSLSLNLKIKTSKLRKREFCGNHALKDFIS